VAARRSPVSTFDRAIHLMISRKPDWRVLFTTVILIIPVLYVVSIWLGYDEAWIHPEQMRAAAYVWTPGTEGYPQLLRKSFDWAALDTSDPLHWRDQTPAHRVRPLSDLAQVIDALARPTISRWLYPHPSLTPSAIATAILAPLLFFGFLRLVFGNVVSAAAFTVLWLSSMGFLSIIVPDIHAAAKRLAVLLLCLSLFLAARHEISNRPLFFWLFVLVLFLSFFTDEMALGGYVVLCVVYAPSFLRRGARWKTLIMVALPALFVAAVKWGMPAMYAVAGAEGMPDFNAFGDEKKLSTLAHLGQSDFYQLAFTQTARALLTTLGVTVHNALTEITALALFIGGSAWLAWTGGQEPAQRRVNYGLVASAVAFLVNSAYLTLLDLYPPGGRTYLASYTYYYHSSLSILAVLWLAFVWQAMAQHDWHAIPVRRFLTIVGAQTCIVVIALNFRSFHNINQLVSLAHSYPYHPSMLYERLRSINSSVKRSGRDEVISIEFNKNCTLVDQQFNRAFLASMGETWRTNEFYKVFRSIALTKRDLEYLIHAHYPQNLFNVLISDDQSGCEEPRLFLSSSSGRPGVPLTLSGYGFKPYGEVRLFWGDLDDFYFGSVFTDASGRFSDVPVVVPYYRPATYNVFASSATGLANSTFTITVSPVTAASVSPDRALPGSRITVTGSGFPPAKEIHIRWNRPDGSSIGSEMADDSGALHPTTATVPQVSAGVYMLYVTNDRDSTATVPITIIESGKNSGSSSTSRGNN
jgi:hypothetical protein